MAPSENLDARDESPTAHTILVVEDEKDARESLALLLRLDGYTVFTSCSGEEALIVSEKVRPSVVLLDLVMPGRSGLDICEELSRPVSTAPSIIFLSGRGDHEIRARGLMNGAVDFVDKPYNYRELCARIQAVLRTRSRIEALSARADIDPLTGLYNRSALADKFAGLIDAAHRYGRELGCLIIDIDHFKAVNDQFGHGAGDDVQREISRRLRATCRLSDIIVRYGGDEFVVIAIETSRARARALAERVRARIANPVISVRTPSGLTSISITASIGVATLQAGLGADEMLQQADGALYRAKHGGRNRVELAGVGGAEAVGEF